MIRNINSTNTNTFFFHLSSTNYMIREVQLNQHTFFSFTVHSTYDMIRKTQPTQTLFFLPYRVNRRHDTGVQLQFNQHTLISSTVHSKDDMIILTPFKLSAVGTFQGTGAGSGGTGLILYLRSTITSLSAEDTMAPDSRGGSRSCTHDESGDTRDRMVGIRCGKSSQSVPVWGFADSTLGI